MPNLSRIVAFLGILLFFGAFNLALLPGGSPLAGVQTEEETGFCTGCPPDNQGEDPYACCMIYDCTGESCTVCQGKEECTIGAH